MIYEITDLKSVKEFLLNELSQSPTKNGFDFVGKFVKSFRTAIFQTNFKRQFLRVEMKMHLAKLFAKTKKGLSRYLFS